MDRSFTRTVADLACDARVTGTTASLRYTVPVARPQAERGFDGELALPDWGGRGAEQGRRRLGQRPKFDLSVKPDDADLRESDRLAEPHNPAPAPCRRRSRCEPAAPYLVEVHRPLKRKGSDHDRRHALGDRPLSLVVRPPMAEGGIPAVSAAPDVRAVIERAAVTAVAADPAARKHVLGKPQERISKPS